MLYEFFIRLYIVQYPFKVEPYPLVSDMIIELCRRVLFLKSRTCIFTIMWYPDKFFQHRNLNKTHKNQIKTWLNVRSIEYHVFMSHGILSNRTCITFYFILKLQVHFIFLLTNRFLVKITKSDHCIVFLCFFIKYLLLGLFIKRSVARIDKCRSVIFYQWF